MRTTIPRHVSPLPHHVSPLILQVHLQDMAGVRRLLLHERLVNKGTSVIQIPTGVLPINTSGLLIKTSFQLPLPNLHTKQVETVSIIQEHGRNCLEAI